MSVKAQISSYEKTVAQKPTIEIKRLHTHPVKDKVVIFQKHVDKATGADKNDPSNPPNMKSAIPDPFDINSWRPKKDPVSLGPPPLKWQKPQ